MQAMLASCLIVILKTGNICRSFLIQFYINLLYNVLMLYYMIFKSGSATLSGYLQDTSTLKILNKYVVISDPPKLCSAVIRSKYFSVSVTTWLD